MDHYIDRMMHSRARDVGGTLRSRLGLGPDDTVENLIILGTGFGESIAPDPSVKMRDLGLVFQDVGELHGHDRRAGLATVGGKRCGIISGRYHMGEASMATSPSSVRMMVRMQFEMWCALGLKRALLTCGTGGLDDSIAPAGSLVVVRELMTLFAGQMPLATGEYVTPSASIDQNASERIARALRELKTLRVAQGIYAMVPGPNVESCHDKGVLQSLGATVVGMSLVPSMCIAALHGVQTVGLAFVTNGPDGVLSHKQNTLRGAERKDELRECLEVAARAIFV